MEQDLTNGRVAPLLLRFALPLLCANLLITLYGIVDMIVVGQFEGSTGLSAVTIGNQLTHLLVMLGVGFSSGAQVVISQLKGAGEHEKLNSVIGNAIVLLVLLGILFGAVGVIFGAPLLRVMNTPEEVFAESLKYVRVCCMGLPVVFLYNALSAIMRGLGDSKRPMVFIAIATLMNIALDYLFVGVFDMNVAGAALATVIAQTASALFGLSYLYRRRVRFAFDFKPASFAPRLNWIREIMRLGMPLGFQNSAINISLIFVLSLVNVYGVAASAVIGVGTRLLHVFCMPMQAMNTATIAMSGQCMGAGKPARVKTVTNVTLLINTVVFFVSLLLILLIPEQLIRLFDDSAEVVSLGRVFLYINIPYLIGHIGLCSYQGAALGAGNSMLCMAAFLTDAVLVRVSLSLLLPGVFGMGLMGMFWATGIAPMFAGLVMAQYYYRGNWMAIKTVVERL